MFTYQVRKRKLSPEKGKELIFPNEVEIIFHLCPLELFRLGESGGAKVFGHLGKIDPNLGRISWDSKNLLDPLKVSFKEGDCRVDMHGNELHIYEHCQSYLKLEKRVQELFFAIPILLAIEFNVSPFVEKVTGKVGDVSFGWPLDKFLIFPLPFHIAEDQNSKGKIIETTWKRLNILSTPYHKRVIAGLYHFHVVCRLKSAGSSPWEFMAEVILNMCKILEALFPPTPKNKSTEAAVREGLKELGYSVIEINRDFIPAILLRNNIGSAHISLFDLPREKLDILYEYTDKAEQGFRKMFKILISKIQEGKYRPLPYGDSKRVKKAEDVISKIEEYTKSARGLKSINDEPNDPSQKRYKVRLVVSSGSLTKGE